MVLPGLSRILSGCHDWSKEGRNLSQLADNMAWVVWARWSGGEGGSGGGDFAGHVEWCTYRKNVSHGDRRKVPP